MLMLSLPLGFGGGMYFQNSKTSHIHTVQGANKKINIKVLWQC
jgi:hypothetical protein